MPQLCELPILRLQLFRQVLTLNQRRVFELNVSQNPLSPALPRINDWIIEFSFGPGLKVFDVFFRYSFFQPFQKDLVVHKPIFVLVSYVIVFEGAFCFGDLQVRVNMLGTQVVSLQDGIVQSCKSCGTDYVRIAVVIQEVSHHFWFISLGCCHQWSFSCLGFVVDVSLEPLDKHFGSVQVSVEGCSVERSGFVVDGEITIDEFRFLLQQFTDFSKVLLFNVPKEVLISSIGIGNALHCTHFYIFYIYLKFKFHLELIIFPSRSQALKLFMF